MLCKELKFAVVPSRNQEYPSGEQFMYTMDIRHSTVANLQATALNRSCPLCCFSVQVRTFKDRMTLLHLRNIHHLQNMQLNFVSGSSITHGRGPKPSARSASHALSEGMCVSLLVSVLASSKASPKTLFDFDQAPVQARELMTSYHSV